MKLRTRIVCHRPLLLFRKIEIIRLVLTILILSTASDRVFGLDFSIMTKVDRRGPQLDTPFSQDAKYHVEGRFIRLTEDPTPGSFVGELCCQRLGESAEDYFVRSESDNRAQLLRINSRPYRDGTSVRPTRAIIYEIDGQLVAEKELFHSQDSASLISIARSKTLFGIYNTNKIQVFDTTLELLAEKELPESIYPLSIELSVDGSGMLIVGKENMSILDLNTGELHYLSSCVFSHDRADIKIRADESVAYKYMLLSNYGELCIVDRTIEREFRVNIPGGVIDTYMDGDVVLVLTPQYLYALNTNNGTVLKRFDGIEYLGQAYENRAPFGSPNYGIKNSVEYDPDTRTLYSRGSRDARTFFEIRLVD